MRRPVETFITPPGDDYRIRCPRLGHEIHFSYCRRENRGTPCFKIPDCWHSHFPVVEFLRNDLGPDQWKDWVSQKPVPKILSLVDLIARAKKLPGETSEK